MSQEVKGLKDTVCEKLVYQQSSAEERDAHLKHDRKILEAERTQHQPEDRPKEQSEAEREQTKLYVAVVEEFHIIPSILQAAR